MCVQAFYRFVCRPCGEDEFRVGVEAEAVHLGSRKIKFMNVFVVLDQETHLGCMCFNSVARFVCSSSPANLDVNTDHLES